MKTIYLHIGTMKTGTTALQQFLAANRAILERHGFCYPLLHIGPGNTYDLRNAHFLIYQSPDPDKKTRKEDEKKVWERGLRMVQKAAAKYDHVILSDEMLWYAQNRPDFWERFARVFPREECVWKILVYLRRQDDYVESYWNQKVKGASRYTMTFREYMDQELYAGILPDYEAQLRRMLEFLDKKEILVRPYEKVQFTEGDLLKDFMLQIGLPMSDEYTIPPSDVSNLNLTDNFIELKRWLNLLEDYQDTDNLYRRAMLGAYEAAVAMDGVRNHWSMFSPGEREQFLACYQAGNDWIAREFLGREDGSLFFEAPKELPEWKFCPEKVPRDVFLTLAEADIYQQRKIQSLKNRVKELEKKLLEEKQKAAERTTELAERIENLQYTTEQLAKRQKTLYNSLIFRVYRKLRKWLKKEE